MFRDELPLDLRYAIRALQRSRGFAAIAIATLAYTRALGIGANTAIFTVVNGVLLRSLPYKSADRLYQIFGSVPPTDNPNGPSRRVSSVQVCDVAALRAQSKTLSHIGFFLPFQATLTLGGDVARIERARTTVLALDMLGAQPIVGRTFDPKEEVSAADAVAILSYGGSGASAASAMYPPS